MNRDQKAAVVAEIAAQLEESEAIYAVDYRGISVPQVAELRGRLREADASLRVVKNSLTERAADKVGVDELKSMLEGPTALAFVRGDAALAAKAISDFARAHDNVVEFKGGMLGRELLDAAQVASIARLPSRDVLYGQLVGIVASPVTGLARGLNALLSGIAVALGQVEEQGLVGGDAPPAGADDAPAPAPGAEAAEEAAGDEGTEAPPDADPDAADHDAPVQPDQAEGEDAPAETENQAEESAAAEPADDDAKED